MNRPAQIAIGLTVLLGAAVLGFALYAWKYAGSDTAQIAPSPPPPTTAAAQTGAIPEILPEFVLKDSNNQPRSIREWQGKSLVLNFWATWCPPCLREIPLLIDVNSRRAAQDVQVIGVAVDFRDAVLAYAHKAGIDYPLLIGEQEALDAAAQLGVESMGLPFTVFTDKQNRIVTLRLGELEAPEIDRILDAVHALNEGRLTVEQAQQQIAAHPAHE